MSNLKQEEWHERCEDRLSEEWLEYLDEPAMVDFLLFLEKSKHFQELWSGWLKTKEGEAWYSAQLDKLVRDCPENDEDSRVDR